jgi:Tripartite tricarboxylate transporter family receptor
MMTRKISATQALYRQLHHLAISGICILALVASSICRAEESPSFKGRSISMLLGFTPGGGVDATGRVMAPLLSRYLPGQPTIVPRYMPGAAGVIAFNYIVQQTKPDGLLYTIAPSEPVDPINYRRAATYYDPKTFHYFGGIHRGGNALLISRAAEKRLYDRSAAPVVMGSVGAWPRAAMQVALWGIEYLGWNARWVTGYAGTSDVMLALDRGEIDMTATANLFQIKELVGSGRFRILNQSGSLENGKYVGRPDFGNAPLVTDLLAGKINDPLGQKAFKYWFNVTAMDKVFALAPGTPASIVATYRDAFSKSVADPEFAEIGKRISEEFMPMSYGDVETLIAALSDTPPEVVDWLTAVLGRQGLKAN